MGRAPLSELKEVKGDKELVGEKEPYFHLK